MNSTELIRRVAAGDPGAEEELFEACYEDLHQRAQRMMGAHPKGTLQPTILVHEAWMKLRLPEVGWEGKRHFISVATRAMRCVYIDHARSRQTLKREGTRSLESQAQEPADSSGRDPAWRMLALNEALEAMEQDHPRAFRVAELRLFGGLSHAEIARVMEVTERTVERAWKEARERLTSVL